MEDDATPTVRPSVLLSTVMASMWDGFLVLGPDGRIRQANPSFCRMTGFSTEELVGTGTPRPYWPSEATADMQARFDDYLSGQAGEYELTLRRKDGEPLHVLTGSSSVTAEDGAVLAYLVTVKDITERKRTEQALREAEERYRTLADAAFEGVALHDGEVIIEANLAVARMFGYDPDELPGLRTMDLVAPSSRPEVRERVSAASEEPYEAIGLRKDGSTFDCEVVGKAVPFQGRTVRVVAVRDITERKARGG